MAIVKLHKVTLFGPANQRQDVLDGLQRLGCMHPVNLRAQRVGTALEHPQRNEVQTALRYLDACPIQEPTPRHHRGLDSRDVAREALAIQDRRRALSELRDQLRSKIEVASPWGEFRMPAADALGGQRLWFYAVRHRQLHALAAAHLVWQVVSQDNQFAYLVVVSAEQPKEIPGELRELDPRPLSELKARLIDVEEELERTQLRRTWLTRWSDTLRKALDQVDDELARQEAQRLMLEDPSLFAIQGWVPLSAEKAVRQFAADRRLALTVARPQPDEQPPTLLKNPQVVAGAEGAVTFYITPEYRSWDPTWVVFFSFCCFFAMIVSDAGYGLVLGVLLALLWRRLGGSARQMRFRSLLVTLALTTCAYGVMLGSYFGVEPPQDSLAGRLQLRFQGQPLMGEDSRYAMMGVAVSIGVFHLMLANVITAWRYRWSARSLGAVGWAIVLIGGWVWGLGGLPMMARETALIHQWLATTCGVHAEQVKQALVSIGKACVVAGLICVFAFSSTRPLFSRRISDWSWRGLDGLQALTGVSQAFGDVLSYLRLFALGLASAQLATTFNSLAVETAEIPGVGILLAILIALAGHGINMLLGIMGGVVHGLRLNCIEFFNWSLKEEGYPFRAFCKKAGY